MMQSLASYLLLSAALFATDERPNVLLIVVDDLGYAELGCQGGRDIPTPHIDSLATQGVRFTQGYVTAPYCSPSRAGLLTGRMQTRFGAEFNPIGRANFDPRAGLPESERTIADYLHATGYATGLAGKWHLGGTPAQHPQRRGFDEFFGFLHEGHFYVPGPPWRGATSFLRRKDAGGRITDGDVIWSSHLSSNEPPYDRDNPLLRGTMAVDEPAYLSQALAREAGDFIDRHAQQPWFLMLTFNAPHSPMQATAASLKRFAHIEDIHRRVFAAMVAELDDAVGQVLARLRERGLDGRTLVMFLSDNGGPTKELTSSNAPLRGGKGQLYEGGLRVPFLMLWPGQIPAGRVVDDPVTALDLLPTILAAAGVSLPEIKLDGRDLLPQLKGQPATERTFFWRYGTNLALREGHWKLVRQSSPQSKKTDWELFDLAADVAEQNNLAVQQPEVVERLRHRLETINAEMVPPRWTGR